MKLTWNNDLERFEFRLVDHTEREPVTGRLGLAVASSVTMNVAKDWSTKPPKLFWWTKDVHKAQALSAHADPALRDLILRTVKERGGCVPVMTWVSGVYIWSPAIIEANGVNYKDIVRNAGFTFCRTPDYAPPLGLPNHAGHGFTDPVWWTNSTPRAMKVAEYADEAAALAIGDYAQRRENALKESRAEDADIVIPVPEGLTPFGFQRAGVAYVAKRLRPGSPVKGVLIGDEMGLGKFLPVDTRVLTPVGWTRMGSVRTGETLTRSDGRTTTVTGVYPQGVKPAYRVTFSDHSSVEAGDEHLWTVRYRRGGRTWADLTLTTEQLRTRPKIGTLDLSKTTLYLPMLTAPVEFCTNGLLVIPPYTMGALIANGSLTLPSPEITTNALDGDEIDKHLSKEGVDYRRDCRGTVNRFYLRAAMRGPLESLGLRVRSALKFIPRMYLRSRVDQRIALLQGLMDADGSTNGRGALTYHTVSLALARDVQELTEQLGGIASIRTYDRTEENKPIEYQVRLRLPAAIKPFRVVRKASRLKPGRLALPCRTIESVEYAREVESVCIAVDAPDQLFTVEHCILTHNTIQAALVVNYFESIKRVLIICPASIKKNWQRELETWLVRPTTIGIADTRYSRVVPNSDIVIINYDILANRTDTGKRKEEKVKDGPPRMRKVFRYELREALKKEWDLIVVDECHRLKGDPKQVVRSRMVLAIPSKFWLMLTGTPVPNRPKEFWNILHLIAPKAFPDKGMFLDRYCKNGDRDYNGAQNLDELRDKLRTHIMVRRLKRDVLKDLPPKLRQVIELPAASCEGLVKAELLAFETKEEVLTTVRLRVELAKASEDINDYKQAVAELTKGIKVAFEELSRIRRDTAIAKVPVVTEHVASILSEGQKVLLFCHHKEVARAMQQTFMRECVVIDGDVPPHKRQAIVDRFQQDDSIRLFIGTIGAAGEGLTLTASSYVVFAELDWVPGKVCQAEDRAHRHGQKDSVLVQHLVLEGSLDKRMADVLVEKQAIADRLLDTGELSEAEEVLDGPVVPEREKMATQGVTPTQVARDAAKLTDRDIKAVQYCLRVLAGAHKDSSIYDVRFRSVDAPLGTHLAQLKKMTPRQAALGQRFLNAYKGDLAAVPEFQQLFTKGK